MNYPNVWIGMVFEWEGKKMRVEEEGTYTIENGERVELDNRRRNKWWCRQIEPDGPAVLLCFDSAIIGDKPMYEGISLRDYFACQVVGVLVQQYAKNGIAEPERVSERAYLYADAMLKARDK